MARFDQGWVKLHRQHSEVDFGNDGYISWIYYKLMLWANLQETKIKNGKDQITVPRGGVVTSLIDLSEATGFNRKIVRRCIEWLVKHNYISYIKFWNGALITITGYEFFQTKGDSTKPCETSETENGGEHGGQQGVHQRATKGDSKGTHIEESRIQEPKNKKEEREENPLSDSFSSDQNQGENEMQDEIDLHAPSDVSKNLPPGLSSELAECWQGLIKKKHPRANISFMRLKEIIESSRGLISHEDILPEYTLGCFKRNFTQVLTYAFVYGTSYQMHAFFQNPSQAIVQDKNGITPMEEVATASKDKITRDERSRRYAR